MAEVTEKAIAEAIDTWYSAHYPFGVRLRWSVRANLAHCIARRLGVTTEQLAMDHEKAPGVDHG